MKIRQSAYYFPINVHNIFLCHGKSARKSVTRFYCSFSKLSKEIKNWAQYDNFFFFFFNRKMFKFRWKPNESNFAVLRFAWNWIVFDCTKTHTTIVINFEIVHTDSIFFQFQPIRRNIFNRIMLRFVFHWHRLIRYVRLSNKFPSLPDPPDDGAQYVRIV